MENSLINPVGSTEADNLISRAIPAAEIFGVVLAQLASGAADITVKRGTLLGRNASGKMVVYNGSTEAKTQKFSGDGSETEFELDDKPDSVDEVKVGTSDAEISDYNPYTGVVTLSAAPAAGTDNVVVSYTVPASTPSAILADDATLTDDADVSGVAYRCGCFSREEVKAASGYSITEADEAILREYGISLIDSM